MDDRSLATVLAALEFWKHHLESVVIRQEYIDIASESGKFIILSSGEVDVLQRLLNCAAVRDDLTEHRRNILLDFLFTDFPPHEPERWMTTDGYCDEAMTNGRRAAEALTKTTGCGTVVHDPIGDEQATDSIVAILHHAHASECDVVDVVVSAVEHFTAEAGPLPNIIDHEQN